MCRLGHRRQGHGSAKGQGHVKGAAEGDGSIGVEAAATGYSAVALGLRFVPTLSAGLMRTSQMALARCWRTALRQSGPLKPLHHALEAACGMLPRKDERSNQSLEPRWRRLARASAERPHMAEGCFRVLKKVRTPHKISKKHIREPFRTGGCKTNTQKQKT